MNITELQRNEKASVTSLKKLHKKYKYYIG